MILSSLLRFASTSEETVSIFNPVDDLENTVSSLAFDTVVYAAISLVVLVLVASFVKDRIPRLKVPLFALMVVAMAGSIVVLIGSTVYLNTNSDSGGPVHWHADFEIWACNNELELRDPSGFSNKVGTWVLHEHDDQRIHLEGVVVDETIDASLGKFMFVVGGEITDSTLIVPLNDEPDKWFENDLDGDGPSQTNTALVSSYISNNRETGIFASFMDGLSCGRETADVQTFVYHFDEANDVYWQEKISAPEHFSINDQPNVPPGDCIIFEFSPTKERTDKLCAQFGIRDIEKCEAFGVDPSKPGVCKIHEVGLVTESGQIIEIEDLKDESLEPIQPLEGTERLEADDA